MEFEKAKKKKQIQESKEELQRFIDQLKRMDIEYQFYFGNLLTKEHKYRWHDLKKDPLDLPDAGQKVRLALDCATGRKNVIDGFIGYGDMEWYTMDVGYFRRERSDKDNRVHSAFTVIAWREIEQYETGEV